jgi:hypothetical protein
MKKIVLFSFLLTSTCMLNAAITVTKLWERSRAGGNAAERVKITDTSSQRTIAVANDTIFLSDNNASVWGNSSLIHCYSTANGDFLESFNSPKGDNVTLADDANHIATIGTEGASSFDLSIRENGQYTKIPLGPTYKLALPAVMGDFNGTAYVFTFVANDKQIRRYTLVNKEIVGEIKTVTITDLPAPAYTTRETSVMPLTKDLVAVTMTQGFTTYIDMNHGDYLYNNLNRFITKNVPVSGALVTTQLGGDVFTYKGRVYLVQGWTPSIVDGEMYSGAFKIYDITNPTNVSVTYTHTDDLGHGYGSFSTVSFQTVVKEDGVYIYEYVPTSGMAAFKFVDDTPTALTEHEVISSCYAENGVVKVVAPLGERVELYNLAGQLITSTTTCESVTSFDAEANHFVIVRVAGQTHKVVL